MRRPMRAGIIIFAHFTLVPSQIMPLDKPVAPFVQQRLRKQGSSVASPKIWEVPKCLILGK